MAAQDARAAAAAQIPQLHLSILAGGGKQAVALCERKRGDTTLVRAERALGTRGGGRPQPHRAGDAATGQTATARRHLEHAWPVALTPPGARKAPRIRAPQPDAMVLAGGRQQPQVAGPRDRLSAVLTLRQQGRR